MECYSYTHPKGINKSLCIATLSTTKISSYSVNVTENNIIAKVHPLNLWNLRQQWKLYNIQERNRNSQKVNGSRELYTVKATIQSKSHTAVFLREKRKCMLLYQMILSINELRNDLFVSASAFERWLRKCGTTRETTYEDEIRSNNQIGAFLSGTGKAHRRTVSIYIHLIHCNICISSMEKYSTARNKFWNFFKWYLHQFVI